MCKHQLKQQFLTAKAEAELANNTPDDKDLEKVTGLTYKDFGSTEGAVQAYNFAMGFLFQKRDPFAIRCTLFSNLNLTETIQSN